MIMNDETKKSYPLAWALWAIVGTGLAVGVLQTAVKAAALFTG